MPIRLLDPIVSNQIAAGEVVERPSAVVKELVENSLDAGATVITVEVQDGGTRSIRIRDNGCGLSREEALLAFQRHATSKISTLEDLDSITSMGFRGEALPSIASVSIVEVFTRTEEDVQGTHILIRGGRVETVEAVPCAKGFDITVSDLFFNTPARRKFLKTPETEWRHIIQALTRAALAWGQVHFKVFHQGREQLNVPVFADLRERMASILGADFARKAIPLDEESEVIGIEGFLGHPSQAKASKENLHIFVNLRPVRDHTLLHAVFEAAKPFTPDNRYPEGALFLQIRPDLVDVNVHPSKVEVRFHNSRAVHQFVFNSLRKILNTMTVGEEGLGERQQATGTRDPGEGASDSQTSRVYREPFLPDVSQVRRDLAEPTGEVESLLPGPAPVWPPAPVQNPARYESSHARENQPLPRKDPSPAIAPSQELLALDSGLEHFAAEQVDSQWKALGQFLDTFILAQNGLDLLLIDQHVCHERILFEDIMDKVERALVQVQTLLFAAAVTLNPVEFAYFLEHREHFLKVGFDVEDFGEGSVVIRALPAVLGDYEPREAFRTILHQLADEKPENLLYELVYNIAAMASCKGALKAGRMLSQAEMDHLLADLRKCREPAFCPHGRPVILKVPGKKILETFQRSL